ncbi:5987_t:CDS:2, partial [Ambispora leptoticha]
MTPTRINQNKKIDEEQIAFWKGNHEQANNQTKEKLEVFSTPHKPILTPQKFSVISSKVSTPFKLVEYVFGIVTTNWIEKEIISTKASEFVDDPICNPISKKADALATDLIYNIDIMNMK